MAFIEKPSAVASFDTIFSTACCLTIIVIFLYKFPISDTLPSCGRFMWTLHVDASCGRFMWTLHVDASYLNPIRCIRFSNDEGE